MLKSRSLANRLAWRLAAVMIVAVLLAAAAIAWKAIESVHDLDDLALQTQADLIATELPRAGSVPGGSLALPPALVSSFRSSVGDNVFAVFDGDRLVAASDSAAVARLLPLLPRPFEGGFFQMRPSDGHEHGMVGLVTYAGRWRVIVMQGHEQSAVLLDSMTGNFLFATLWLLLPIGVAMVLVGVITLRRGLRPLTEVSAAAARVGPAHTGARLPVAGLPREIVPIVLAMNDALNRLEQALTAQRHFVAEAAHALRTPLAVLTARLDMLDATPGIDAARADTERMARLVGQLLRMARVDGLPFDLTEPVELHAVAVEAISNLVPLGLHRGVEIALDECPVEPLRGNYAALVVALTNLIENALAHAPSGSVVDVAIAAPATIRVLDRGPGVAPGDRERIFGRFERGVSPSGDGAGLGLAIVAEVAAAHGGSVRAEARAGGGAAFILDLAGGAAAADLSPRRSREGRLPEIRRAAISPACPDAVVAEW